MKSFFSVEIGDDDKDIKFWLIHSRPFFFQLLHGSGLIFFFESAQTPISKDLSIGLTNRAIVGLLCGVSNSLE